MRSEKSLKTAKIGYIMVSIAWCVLGALFFFAPQVAADIMGIICGIILIVFGAVKLIGYFSKDLYRLAFQYDLAFGILLAVLGILMLINPGSLMSFVSIILGLIILADGLLKIQISFDSKKFGIQKWWLIFAIAIAAGVIGITLLAKPSASSSVIMMLLGIAFFVEGILNLCTVVTAVRIIKKSNPDVIESEYREL